MSLACGMKNGVWKDPPARYWVSIGVFPPIQVLHIKYGFCKQSCVRRHLEKLYWWIEWLGWVVLEMQAHPKKEVLFHLNSKNMSSECNTVQFHCLVVNTKHYNTNFTQSTECNGPNSAMYRAVSNWKNNQAVEFVSSSETPFASHNLLGSHNFMFRTL